MAISSNRFSVDTSISSPGKQLEFTTVNDSAKFSAIITPPTKVFNTGTINSVQTVPTLTSTASSVIGDSMHKLDFVKKLPSNVSTGVVDFATSSMINNASTMGSSIGTKSAINSLFNMCPFSGFDGFSFSAMFGLLSGLLPAISRSNQCTPNILDSVISFLTGSLSLDGIVSSIGNGLTSILNNIGGGDGANVINDMNSNSSMLSLSSSIPDRSATFGGILGNAKTPISEDPTEAYDIYSGVADINDNTYHVSASVGVLATKSTLSRTPIVDADDEDQIYGVDSTIVISNMNRKRNTFGNSSDSYLDEVSDIEW